MSEQLAVVEARERLRARLWVGECAIDADYQLAIAGHRLWRALREQRFYAEKEGLRLSAPDLTEGLRRGLFSLTDALTVDAEGFTAWITAVVPLTGPPSAPFLTALEAAWFLARGAFLSIDDITAITEAQIQIAGSVQTVGTPVNTMWELAAGRLFRAHTDSALTLFGRKTPHFGAHPTGDLVPIPREFFAGNVALGLFNHVYDRSHSDRATYCELAVRTAEFSSMFLAPIEPVVPTKAVRPTTRRPTKIDERDFRAWAGELHLSRGFGPSLSDTVKFARQRRLNRNWAREQHKRLDDELRRPRGGRGSTKHLSKPRASD